MNKLFDVLKDLGVDAHVALDLDKHVENGGTIELYHPSSEQRQILDKLRPIYRVAFYEYFVQIKKVEKM